MILAPMFVGRFESLPPLPTLYLCVPPRRDGRVAVDVAVAFALDLNVLLLYDLVGGDRRRCPADAQIDLKHP